MDPSDPDTRESSSVSGSPVSRTEMELARTTDPSHAARILRVRRGLFVSPLARKILAAVLVVLLSMLAAFAAAAQTIDVGTFGSAAAGGSSASVLMNSMTQVFRAILGVAGFICLCQTIWGGFLLATDGGLEDIDEEAKETIKHGVTGLIVTLVAVPCVGFTVDFLARIAGDLFAI